MYHEYEGPSSFGIGGQRVISSIITALLLPGLLLLLWLLLPETFGPPIKEHWRLALAVYLALIGIFSYRSIARSKLGARIAFWVVTLLLSGILLASLPPEFLERWWRSGAALLVATALFRAAMNVKRSRGRGYQPFWVCYIAAWGCVGAAIVLAFLDAPSRQQRLTDVERWELAMSYQMPFPFTLLMAGNKLHLHVPDEGYSDAVCVAHDGYVMLRVDSPVCWSRKGVAAEYYRKGGEVITRRVLTFEDGRNPPYFDCVRFYKTKSGGKHYCPVIFQVLPRQ